jgi:hypothetical protein
MKIRNRSDKVESNAGKENSVTENSIKIVSEEFDPPLNGTIKKIEIELHKPTPSLRKLFSLNFNREKNRD